MEKVVGIRFRNGGKIYHFDPGELSLKRDDYVIVNTEQGLGFGQVVEGPSAKDHPHAPRGDQKDRSFGIAGRNSKAS